MTEIKFPKLSQPSSEATSTTGETQSTPKTLLIFDFDDTLFCTKYFDSFSLPYSDIFSFKVSLEEINPCLFKEIKELEKTIIELFIKIQNNSNDIVIVSNADMKWINNCLTHFLEELKEFINDNNIKVYSAKNMFSNLDSNQKEESAFTASTGWKMKCFEKVIKDLYLDKKESIDVDNNIDLKVLSIGDGEDEKKAVFKLKKDKFNFCQNLERKFIKMIDYPSASSIIIQLEYLQNNITEILDSNKNIYKMLIEMVNGTTQIKCVPKKKKDKINKISKISSFYENKKKLEYDENKINEKEQDFFLFKNFNEFGEDELVNDNLYGFLDNDEDLLRKNLFLGQKRYF